MSKNREIVVPKKSFCCNPLAKANHKSWRKTTKITKVTQKVIDSVESIESAIVPNLRDKICVSCRVEVTRQQNTVPMDPMDVVENEIEDCMEHSANISAEAFQSMMDILLRLGIQNFRVRELRLKNFRCQMLKQAVDALKHLLKVDCPVYYEDTDVPVIKDMIDNCKTASKPIKFQILTLLTPSWSRQKMMDETGCSKYANYNKRLDLI